MKTENKTQAILTGSPFPVLLSFALPIICGNIFQQLYNVVDAIVVGKYLGDLPLAGISAASPIMDVLYGIITGSTVGVGALLGRLNGAGDHERLRRIHATTLLAGGAVVIFLSLAGLLGGRAILTAQNTEPQVIEESMKYLTVIFLGLILNFGYCYYASALRSCGNSRTPFIVLLASSTLHAGLDILFAGVLKMGIRGVAISTVSCQLLSTLVLFFYAQKNFPVFSLNRESRADRREIRPIAGYAFSGALQQIVVQLGRLLIQGMLSEMPLTGLSFSGSSARTHMVTGYNMGVRTETFLFCITQGVSAGASVCIAQNFGNKRIDRVGRYLRCGILTALAYGLLMALSCRLFAPQLISIFSGNAEVIQAGALYAGTMSFFYLFSTLNEMLQAFFRGLGKLKICLLASSLQVLVRVVLSALLIPRFGIRGICYAVAIGWILMAVTEGPFAIYTMKHLKAPVAAKG